MIYNAQRLYHGTTVGWLHVSGFGETDFAYGEFTDPHPFIFLCTQRSGAESAACKAYTKVNDRHGNHPPFDKYHYAGNDYAVDRYVYTVNFDTQINVLDFHAEKLDNDDMTRVKTAIELRASSISKMCLAYIGLTETWQDLLKAAFRNQRNEIVHTLGLAGFDLIRNLEPDNDGQQYGEVWALPMSKVACAIPQQPEIYELGSNSGVR